MNCLFKLSLVILISSTLSAFAGGNGAVGTGGFGGGSSRIFDNGAVGGSKIFGTDLEALIKDGAYMKLDDYTNPGKVAGIWYPEDVIFLPITTMKATKVRRPELIAKAVFLGQVKNVSVNRAKPQKALVWPDVVLDQAYKNIIEMAQSGSIHPLMIEEFQKAGDYSSFNGFVKQGKNGDMVFALPSNAGKQIPALHYVPANEVSTEAYELMLKSGSQQVILKFVEEMLAPQH